MNPRHAAIAVLALLTACGTPQEQCIRKATRELRTIDRLMAEVQGNLDRGYAWEERQITRTEWVVCGYYPAPPRPDGTQRPLRPRYCLDDVVDTIRHRVAIDPAAEQRKLDGLRAKRAEVNRAAAAEVRACRATYPE